jgi:hypothetical protein
MVYAGSRVGYATVPPDIVLFLVTGSSASVEHFDSFLFGISDLLARLEA